LTGSTVYYFGVGCVAADGGNEVMRSWNAASVYAGGSRFKANTADPTDFNMTVERSTNDLFFRIKSCD